MAPEAWITLVGSTLTGISGLILAVSGYRRTRNTQIREDLEQCWQEQQRLRTKLHEALGHVGTLEELLAMNRVKVPGRPPSLDPGRTVDTPAAWQPRHAAA